MLVRGENWEVINHQWTRFGLGFLLEFSLSIRSQQPWEFSVIRSLNLFAKGTKGLHKKWRQVMAGCSVQVQCTFTWVKSITRQPLLKRWLSNRHARSPNLHAFVFPQLQDFVFCFLFFGSCTLHLLWREGGWAEFWCSTMQVQYFKDHAKCIHFTGIYSMLSIKTGWEVHNDIQLISKKKKKKGAQMFTQCYSNLTEKKDKKGALVYVLAIVF